MAPVMFSHEIIMFIGVVYLLTKANGASFERLCPSNITLKHDERWTSCYFPHILRNQRGCGRPRNETWDFRLCDPDYLLSYSVGWSLEEYIRGCEETTPYTCKNIREAPQNFTFAVAIVKSIAVPDLTSDDACINNCGAILPKLEGREATNEEVEAAMQQLASSIKRQWALGSCGNDIVIVYSKQNQAIYTAVGNRAAITLTKEKLQTLNSGAVDYFFKRDELVPGIKYLIASYKQVLLGFSPAHVLLLINACLIIFVLLCLFLVFNLGRELNVLNDESIPTKALKWILYAISFLWIIKWWLWLLGWVGEKPKTRMAYLFLPAGICLICVLVAWVSSPNNFQLIQDTISKQ